MSTRVIEREVDGGSWLLAVRDPHPALRPHVLTLEGYEEHMPAPVRQRHLPTVFVPVILNFGAPFRLLEPAGPGTATHPRSSFVSGLGEAGGVTESDGNAVCVQVDLTPLGARRILGVPMHELEDRVVELEDVFGPEAQRLEEQLFDLPDWESRLDLVEASIAARLADGPPVRADVAWAWRRLEETAGRIRVGELADELRCSRKHLLAQFREHVGPRPQDDGAPLPLQPPSAPARQLASRLGGTRVPVRLLRPVAPEPRGAPPRPLHAGRAGGQPAGHIRSRHAVPTAVASPHNDEGSGDDRDRDGHRKRVPVLRLCRCSGRDRLA